jgi:hypothetical protein
MTILSKPLRDSLSNIGLKLEDFFHRSRQSGEDEKQRTERQRASLQATIKALTGISNAIFQEVVVDCTNRMWIDFAAAVLDALHRLKGQLPTSDAQVKSFVDRPTCARAGMCC